MEDVSLKGFLQTPQSLGWLKLGKLLARQEFHDLRTYFPELDEFIAVEVPILTEIQLELDLDGFDFTPPFGVVRLPVGREGRVRLTIQKVS